LSEQELVEEVTRILTGDDPNVPKNVCKFSYKEKCYKPDPPGQGDNMATHFSREGSSLHVDSDEWKKYYHTKDDDADEQTQAGSDHDAKVTSEMQTTTSCGVSTSTSGVPNQRKNQFNYSERASQTFNNPLRSRGVRTSPPPVTQYSEQVNQWIIYDAYKSDCLISMMEHKQDGASRSISFEDKLASIVVDRDESGPDRSDVMHSESMENALKIMGRLVNQNAEDEIFQDFKYYEDKADDIKPGQGTLLPLWRFSNDRTSRKQVTSLSWNPRYNDLFAVGYGSYEFTRQSTGAVCCYSLKNTSHPEYVIGTESGVMCLDFHQDHPSLLAVGCYDGTVSVYDIGSGSKKPIYCSSIRSGKHSDPVWQVRWCTGRSSSKEMNFYSISSDGKVAIWTMSKNDLKMEPVMLLKHTNFSKEDWDEPTFSGLAGGCSFDFNSSLDSLFLVGTEEGNIHECSKAYSGQYIKSYDGHHMAVNTVTWNPFHEDIFLSCSADWTVKVSFILCMLWI
jgi:dynein intermediate chain 1